MNTFTINSRDHGPVTFSIPAGHYVFVDLNGQPGTLGNQVCDGGRLSGSTITATEETLESVAKTWWAAYLRRSR